MNNTNDRADGKRNGLITVAELARYGLTYADVRSKCPDAVEYTGIDGRLCWRLEDLAALLTKEGGEA